MTDLALLFSEGLLSGPALWCCWQHSRSALGATHRHYSPVLKSLGAPGGMLRVATAMNSTRQDNFLTDAGGYQPVELPAGVAQADQRGLA